MAWSAYDWSTAFVSDITLSIAHKQVRAFKRL
jgi:hypothetical protein